jgi:hypothetical protein
MSPTFSDWFAKNRRTAIVLLILCSILGISLAISIGPFARFFASLIMNSENAEIYAIKYPGLAAITGLFTAFISFIGTVSTIVFAWRADRRSTKEAERSAKESDIKLIQLIQQIEEMKTKLNAPNASGQDRV